MSKATSAAVITLLREHLVKERAERADEVRSLATEESLFDAGLLDSLSFLGVVQLLEKTYGITVPPEDFSPQRLGSLSQIGEYVAGKA